MNGKVEYSDENSPLALTEAFLTPIATNYAPEDGSNIEDLMDRVAATCAELQTLATAYDTCAVCVNMILTVDDNGDYTVGNNMGLPFYFCICGGEGIFYTKDDSSQEFSCIDVNYCSLAKLCGNDERIHSKDLDGQTDFIREVDSLVADAYACSCGDCSGINYFYTDDQVTEDQVVGFPIDDPDNQICDGLMLLKIKKATLVLTTINAPEELSYVTTTVIQLVSMRKQGINVVAMIPSKPEFKALLASIV